jgi:hypothetical protein
VTYAASCPRWLAGSLDLADHRRMRSGLVVAMILAASCNPSEECTPTSGSVITHQPAAIASGTQLVGVSWRESIARNPPIGHAVLVDAAGVPSFEIQISPEARGIAGRRSVLWGRSNDSFVDAPDCDLAGAPLDVTLHRTDGVEFVHVADATGTSTASTFDGTHYQLFWVEADGRLRQRSLDEAGGLGPVYDLATVAPQACLFAASDGAGTTMLRADQRIYAIEVGGTARMLFERAGRELTHLFYFAGSFHVHAIFDLLSFTSAGVVSTRRLPNYIAGAKAFYPGTGSLFVGADGGIVEVDVALAKLGLVASGTDGGTFDGDFIRVEHARGDVQTPSRLELERTNAWTTTLATDSEVLVEDDCAP